MLISVVVPVYNAEKYIDQCIGSILAQTYADFELLMIDDGSTDSSFQICKRYAEKDKRIKLFQHDNKGVGTTRNVGIDEAHGKYIMFVDSDDYIDEEMLQDGVEHISNGEDLYISGTLMEYYKNGNVEQRVEYRGCQKQYTPTTLLDNYDIEYPLLCIGGPCSKLFRRDILQNTGCYFDTEMSVSEDGLFCMDYISRIEYISFSDKCYYHYRRENANSLWTRYNPSLYAYQCRTYGRMRSLLKECKCSDATVKRFEALYFEIMIGCIRNEYRNKDATRAKKKEIVRKVASNEYVRQYIEAPYDMKCSRRILAHLLRKHYHCAVVVMFDIWSLWKKKKAW